MSNGSSNQACAACKFQRRRCLADCPLAHYFPADQNQRFMNCKRLFGVSNMIRFLKEVHPRDKDDTMNSLIYEADARERDPLHGCVGIINCLKEQVAKLTEELRLVREQLRLLELQQRAATVYQQQFTQSLVAAADPPAFQSPQITVSPAEGSSSYQYSHLNINPAMEYDHHTIRPAGFDSRKESKFSTQSYESRFNEDMLPEHELKSAAALFSLTSSRP